jgi:hypothetical protein
MLSGALQRNAKHEARLSNISGYLLPGVWAVRKNQRFFASLRMTTNEPVTRACAKISLAFAAIWF